MSENIQNEFEVLVNNVRQNIITRGNKVILPSTELTDMPSSYSNGSILVSGTSSYNLATPTSLGIMGRIELTGDTTATVENHYVCNNVSLITVTLPTTAIFGAMIGIHGKGAGGWKIAQNAGQVIHLNQFSSTTGITGYLQSDHYLSSVILMCITANTNWKVIWGSCETLKIN